jgi:hypothetical protein
MPRCDLFAPPLDPGTVAFGLGGPLDQRAVFGSGSTSGDPTSRIIHQGLAIGVHLPERHASRQLEGFIFGRPRTERGKDQRLTV